jgi:hypothetical protein
VPHSPQAVSKVHNKVELVVFLVPDSKVVQLEVLAVVMVHQALNHHHSHQAQKVLEVMVLMQVLAVVLALVSVHRHTNHQASHQVVVLVVPEASIWLLLRSLVLTQTKMEVSMLENLTDSFKAPTKSLIA